MQNFIEMFETRGKCCTLEFSIPHCSRVTNFVTKYNELYIYATLRKKLRDIYIYIYIYTYIHMYIYIYIYIYIPFVNQ